MKYILLLIYLGICKKLYNVTVEDKGVKIALERLSRSIINRILSKCFLFLLIFIITPFLLGKKISQWIVS